MGISKSGEAAPTGGGRLGYGVAGEYLTIVAKLAKEDYAEAREVEVTA